MRAARGWWPWLRAAARWERMRQWRCRVARVRQQPLIFGRACSRGWHSQIRCSWRGRRSGVANSQTWAALRFSRLARVSPGCLPLCQGRDSLTEIPMATALVAAVARPGQEGGVQAGLAGVAGSPDHRSRGAQGVADPPGAQAAASEWDPSGGERTMRRAFRGWRHPPSCSVRKTALSLGHQNSS